MNKNRKKLENIIACSLGLRWSGSQSFVVSSGTPKPHLASAWRERLQSQAPPHRINMLGEGKPGTFFHRNPDHD